MSNKFQPLRSDDVVSIKDAKWVLLPQNTFTTDEMMQSLKKHLGTSEWLSEGIECKVLQPGSKSWQYGKVRVYVEFCPDTVLEVKNDSSALANNADSPLDEIRQMMDEDS